MARRDKRRREPKKPKKGTRKVSVSTQLPGTIKVEVIKKGRREAGSGREEE